MDVGAGNASQVASIDVAGLTPINIFNLSAGELADIGILVIQNPSNFAYGAEFLTQLAIIHQAVEDGLILIIHDRFVSDAETILPGSSGFQIIRNDGTDTASIELLNNAHPIASGPGGAVTDTSLDGGTLSSHGFAIAGTLPEGADLILSRTSPLDIVTFEYAFGLGHVVYSTIPLDFYLGGGTTVALAMQAYAANLLFYASNNLSSAPFVEDDLATIQTSRLLANDTDPDGDTLVVSAVSATSTGGAQLTLNGTSIEYDPTGAFDFLAEGETALDTFTYKVSDGRGGLEVVPVSGTEWRLGQGRFRV